VTAVQRAYEISERDLLDLWNLVTVELAEHQVESHDIDNCEACESMEKLKSKLSDAHSLVEAGIDVTFRCPGSPAQIAHQGGAA
jgi:hypothetical protein